MQKPTTRHISNDSKIWEGGEAANRSSSGKHFVIDASQKSLGRIASEAAKKLMGKADADYTPNVASRVHVTIVNAGKLSLPEKKLLAKKYTRYSGYPGGLKTERLQSLHARKGPSEVLRVAIERMLPRNTMRVGRMKRLKIQE